VLLGFVTASLLVGRGFTAFAPGHADARIFAYIGREWLSGVIPYVDVWDNKPPGIFATIALVFALFPDNFGALAVLEGVWVALCHWSIFTLLRQFGAPRRPSPRPPLRWRATYSITTSMASLPRSTSSVPRR
jgi:hypothetical protein